MMENTTIKIGGMSCEGCVKNIQGVLSVLPGVTSAAVSLASAQALVSYDADQVDRGSLLAAIEDAGFDAE